MPESLLMVIVLPLLPSLIYPYFELDVEQEEICKSLLIKQKTEWIVNDFANS